MRVSEARDASRIEKFNLHHNFPENTVTELINDLLKMWVMSHIRDAPALAAGMRGERVEG
ncbi:hypothetical protein C3369_19715 [Escherichia sp. ESNIH1]|nr:hypothetical protein C3369_19715 [Escherichia sp. ESNIH1]